MSFSFTDSTGDGVTQTFPFSFEGVDKGYFDKDQVKVEVDSVRLVMDTDFELISQNTINIFTPPPVGVLVRILREVDATTPYAQFSRGVPFTADNVNRTNEQTLYLMQSLMDGFVPDGFYFKQVMNFGGNKISGILDGTEPDDVATFGQIQDINDRIDEVDDAIALAAAEADRATVEADRAETEADRSASEADDAAFHAADALVSRGQSYNNAVLAGEYAQSPENVPVSAGGFSALHYSKKAEETKDEVDAIASDISMPNGLIAMFAMAAIPVGYLYCNGQAVSRIVYSDLFDTIGTTFGAGDGSTTFNVPDLRDKFLVGDSVANPLGTTGGSASTLLDDANIPNHSHQWYNAGGGSGSIDATTYGTADYSWSSTGTTSTIGGSELNGSKWTSLMTDIRVAAEAVDTLPPFTAMVPCIKAFGSVVQDAQDLQDALDYIAQALIDATAEADRAESEADRAESEANASAASAAAALVTLGDVTTEGATQIGLVQAEGTTQVGLVSTEGSTQVGLVSSEGSTQVGAVSSEGAIQVALVQAEGASYQAQIDTLKGVKFGTDNMIRIEQSHPSGTNGGSIGTGWQTRPLNSEAFNNIVGASFNPVTHELTLPAGTYYYIAFGMAFQCDRTQIRFAGNTFGIIGSGSSEYSVSSASTYVSAKSEATGSFTIAAPEIIRLEQYAETPFATAGMGVAATTGEPELFANAIFWKE